MDTNGNNYCDCMYGTIAMAVHYWNDTKICSYNNRCFSDYYCVSASYYQQNATYQESILQILLVAIVTLVAALFIFKRKYRNYNDDFCRTAAKKKAVVQQTHFHAPMERRLRENQSRRFFCFSDRCSCDQEGGIIGGYRHVNFRHS
ncbi:MAG: hypothetical protein ACLVEU_02860 [Bacteroides cellulosilyticus]